MIEKFRNNPNLKYFILYSLTFTFYGCIIVAPGPVIPFLSSKHHIPETEFTFFFSCRSIGFVVGAIFIRFISGKITSHAIIGIGTVAAGIPFILFPFTDSMNIQGFYILLSSIFCSAFQIVISVCLIEAHRGYHEEFWLQIGHAMFGFGGLLGPIFIGIWEEYGCVLIGLGILIGFPGYIYLQSPEIRNKKQTENKSENKEEQYKFISKKSVIFLSIMFFLYFGEETGFAGWISSYAVMMNLDTNIGATRYPAIFWISMTILRLVSAVLPGKVSEKLIFLTKLQILTYVISIILTMLGFTLFAVYWNSILVGAAYSTMYALIYTLSIEFKQSITQAQTATIMMFGALGEGVLCTVIGYTMNIFSPIALFYFLASTGILMLWLISLFMKDLDENEPKQKAVELREKLNS